VKSIKTKHLLILANASRLAELKGGKCLSTEYSHRKKLEWECAAGHRWLSQLRSIRDANSWCPRCSGHFRDSSDLKLLAESKGGAWLGETYKGMQVKTRWRCANSHEWETTPATVFSGKAWCPICSQGLGERLTRKAFEDICMKPFPKIRPDWLINQRGKQMELDGYNEEIGIAFEHQGTQHYKLSYFSPSIEILHRRKSDDAQKLALCLKNKVTLFFIPEIRGILKLENLEQFIRNTLKEYAPAIMQSTTAVNYTSAYITDGAEEEMVILRKIVHSQNGTCLSPHYMGSRQKLILKCGSGHTWGAAPDTLKQGKWCPFCSAAKKADKVRPPINVPKEFAEKKGGKLISPTYKNSKEKLEWECAEGHRWMAKFNLIRQGTWCPFCAKLKKLRLPIGDLEKITEGKGFNQISGIYKRKMGKLEWECDKGHRWNANIESIKQSKYCPICSINSINLSKLVDFAKQKGGRVLSLEYKSIKSHLKWECSKGHHWLAKPNNVMNGTWCPICARNKKLNIEDMKSIAALRGGACLSETYINARTKLEWRCAKGHIWHAQPYSIKSGCWCPKCAGKK